MDFIPHFLYSYRCPKRQTFCDFIPMQPIQKGAWRGSLLQHLSTKTAATEISEALALQIFWSTTAKIPNKFANSKGVWESYSQTSSRLNLCWRARKGTEQEDSVKHGIRKLLFCLQKSQMLRIIPPVLESPRMWCRAIVHLNQIFGRKVFR